jgi:BNR repeat-containing family member
VFVPATALYPNSGSPVLSVIAQGAVRPSVYLLDPSTNEALGGWVTLPGHWKRFRVLVVHSNLTTTSTGNVVLELRYNSRAAYLDRSTISTLDEAIRLARRNNVAGQYVTARTAVGWGIAVTQADGDSYEAVPGSPIAFRIVRKADDPLDTFTQDLAVLGVMFVRDELPDPPAALYSTDCAYSWWSTPRTAYISGKPIVGGASQTGEIVLNVYEKTTTTSERRVIAQSDYSDDHQTPSILTKAGNPPIVFWNYHGHDNFIRYRKSTINDALSDELGPEKSIGFTSNAAYQQVFTTPTGEIVLFSRIGNFQWQVTWSGDWGESWSTPRTWISFGSRNQGYMIGQQMADGNKVRVAAYGHPTIGTFHDIVYMELDLTNGDVKNRNGTLIGNFRTGATISSSTPWEVVRAQPGGTGTRLFDVSNAANPEILLASWTNDDDSVYKYLYWTGSAWE